jgi:hypothetical protein
MSIAPLFFVENAKSAPVYDQFLHAGVLELGQAFFRITNNRPADT